MNKTDREIYEAMIKHLDRIATQLESYGLKQSEIPMSKVESATKNSQKPSTSPRRRDISSYGDSKYGPALLTKSRKKDHE